MYWFDWNYFWWSLFQFTLFLIDFLPWLLKKQTYFYKLVVSSIDLIRRRLKFVSRRFRLFIFLTELWTNQSMHCQLIQGVLNPSPCPIPLPTYFVLRVAVLLNLWPRLSLFLRGGKSFAVDADQLFFRLKPAYKRRTWSNGKENYYNHWHANVLHL